MKVVDGICRKFLWTGEVVDSRKALVSWDNVCRTKVECGLSLVHLPTWDKLATMKVLWDIHNKADKLWIKWLLRTIL